MDKKNKIILTTITVVTIVVIGVVLLFVVLQMNKDDGQWNSDDESKFYGSWRLENPFPYNNTETNSGFIQTWTFYSNSSMKFYYYEFMNNKVTDNYTIFLTWNIENGKLTCDGVFTYHFSENNKRLTLLPIGGSVELILDKMQ